MAKQPASLRGTWLAAAICPLAFLLVAAFAHGKPEGDTARILRAQAEHLESLGDWAAAADKYEELYRLDRTQNAVRQRGHYCLGRLFQVLRFRDPSYQKDVLSLKYPQAIRLYELVLQNLLHNPLDRDKISGGALFRKGLEEFCLALASPEFCAGQLGGLLPEQTRPLRNYLQAHYSADKSMTGEDSAESVRDVVMRSVNHYPTINPTAVIMEFLCGACLAVDDYTVYLTPRQLRELCATLKGRSIGVGLRLQSQGSKMTIADVLPHSPAAELSPPLVHGDLILAIDKKATSNLSAESAMEMLEGDEGSIVELLVESLADGPRIVVLRRQELFVPSVRIEALGNIGYCKINCFQETTLDEFDAGLAELNGADCKALILDLRGNPGGLVDVAIEIARRFVRSGVILTMQHQDPKIGKVYRSENEMAMSQPLVVLVDGDTASAAEVLAGALKENRRATLIGQTTYGKGCTQGLLRLPSEAELRSLASATGLEGGTGGIRITIARFYSPTGQPYSGRGVEPDIRASGELVLYQARELAQKLVGMQ